jgi:hypothetical protein
MTELNEFIESMHHLSLPDKQTLLTLLTAELTSTQHEKPTASVAPNNPMLGLLADDPELADELVRQVVEHRNTQPWRTPDE